MNQPSCAICVFAKAPHPGAVKTRLADVVGERMATRLARAFFEDTWAQLKSISWARPILATTDTLWTDWCQVDPDDCWEQGDGDLGVRQERVLRRALETASSAIALAADTPGLPERLLLLAREALREVDAVIGPASDGGYYLLGLKHCPEGLLDSVQWSSASAYEQTLARLRQHDMEVMMLPQWFDVDTWQDLVRLRGLLDRGVCSAPRTHSLLAEVDRS